MSRSCAPFDRVTVPVYAWPDIALGVILVVAGKMTYVVAVVEPEAPILHVPESSVKAELPPAHVNEMVATEALPEPVLVRVR